MAMKFKAGWQGQSEQGGLHTDGSFVKLHPKTPTLVLSRDL